jgi:hypothetical protein
MQQLDEIGGLQSWQKKKWQRKKKKEN